MDMQPVTNEVQKLQESVACMVSKLDQTNTQSKQHDQNQLHHIETLMEGMREIVQQICRQQT